MIIGILGEGRYDVGDDRLDELGVLDAQVQAAADAEDDTTFTPLLGDLLAAVRQLGTPVPEDAPITSELVLPPEGTELRQVRALLGDEGFIPGHR